MVDYNQWQLFDGGYWNGITTIQNKLVGMNTNGRLYKHNGTIFEEFFIMNQSGLDIRTNDDFLIVTNQNYIYIFNAALQQTVTINSCLLYTSRCV